jgi:hypothetical protein
MRKEREREKKKRDGVPEDLVPRKPEVKPD